MKELTAPELLQAVVKIKELCANRKSCEGCIFNEIITNVWSGCAISATMPSLWRLGNIQEYLETHKE